MKIKYMVSNSRLEEMAREIATYHFADPTARIQFALLEMARAVIAEAERWGKEHYKVPEEASEACYQHGWWDLLNHLKRLRSLAAPKPKEGESDKDDTPDGWLVLKEGKEGNPYCYSHVFFPYEINLLDWAKRNISKGWCIRPVRLQFLDEDKEGEGDE